MKFALGLVALVALAVACGTTTTDLPAGDATAGQDLYTTNCETCHGADAKSGSAGENLVGEVGEQSEFISAIQNGKDNGAMPAFPELSDQDIADIIAYVETL